MIRNDRLDASLAKHFAWSFARSGALTDLEDRLRAARASGPPSLPSVPPAPPPAPSPADEAEIDALRDRMRKACRALTAAIEKAWAVAEAERVEGGKPNQGGTRLDAGDGAKATKRLLVRAERLDHVLAGLDDEPVLAVRLARLFVRYGAAMTRHQRERAAHVATLLPLQDPEVAELLVDVARAGDREMARALLSDEEWEPDLGDERSVAVRLADIIEGAAGHASRVAAIDLLSVLGGAARSMAVPALRGALRLPSLTIRGHALTALLAVHPVPLSDADVVPLLRELALHALPEALGEEEREEDERLLADALLEAIARLRPAEAEEALLDIIDAEHDALWLDAAWATEALASAFPETAAAMVDYWLGCAPTHVRSRALGALARLPDELAEPRLRLAMSDPAFTVRDSVRRMWLHRFARACPTSPSDLVGAEQLAGAPSEAFLSRLAVMQGRVKAAREAMARALLAEAPDREALVLLVQYVGDDADSREPCFGTASPEKGSEVETWASMLARRFGAPGVAALCALAARFHEPDSFGWLRRLGDLVEQGAIAREHAAPVRELAARHVANPDGGRVEDALRVLALVGAPGDLLEPALALALEDDSATYQAASLLVSWPSDHEGFAGGGNLDRRLASEMSGALEKRSWLRLERAASVAVRRGIPAALEMAEGVLVLAEREEEAVDAAVEIARRLREKGRLDDAWALRAVARPESPIFSVAVRTWWRSPLVRDALEAALASKARQGASAVEAAVALLHGEPPLSPRDKRLPRLLERSTLEGKARLVGALALHGPSPAYVKPYLEALFLSSDPRVTCEMSGVAAAIKSPPILVWLRGILPRVVDPELAADIEESLGGPWLYWQEP
jgi:hypothetical protein